MVKMYILVQISKKTDEGDWFSLSGSLVERRCMSFERKMTTYKVNWMKVVKNKKGKKLNLRTIMLMIK